MIKEHNFLPITLPHQKETNNFHELRRGASEPSCFMMGLDLEKSKGQASGFDSAASSVDIELIVKLRDHFSIVGQVGDGDGTAFRGASASCNFQPVKRRIHFTDMVASETYTATGLTNNTAAVRVGTCTPNYRDDLEIFTDDDLTKAFTRTVPGVPNGSMQDKQLTYNVTEGTKYTTHSTTANTSGVYSRIYLFAHVDQVLRLSAVGRMEIVR